MKKEVPPDTVSDFSAFPSLPYPYSRAKITGRSTLGHVSQDGTWAWVARDSVLDVFTTSTKERYGSWRFGAVVNKDNYVITAIVELCSPRVKFPCLLVAVDRGNGEGYLCMFNPRASKVLKVIHLPYKITSIDVVSSQGGVSVKTNPLCDILRCMFGTVAIGTQYGHLFFLDLCLDEKNFSDESSPSSVKFIGKSTRNVSEIRELCLSHKQHLCLLLNDCHLIGNEFEYQSANSVLATYTGNEIYVSALKYVPKMASLAVGFNFGGIQIWNLRLLYLEQSIPVHPSGDFPVVKFEFQEPENDPREFCFLWVIKGHHEGENFRPHCLSVASLYSLTFSRKIYINNFGYLYEDLVRYSKRLDHVLSNDSFSPSINSPLAMCSRLIMLRVLRPFDSLCRNDADENALTEELIVPDELSLLAMAWEVWPLNGDVPTAAYLTFFDINQWYRAQMPSVLRYDNGDFCSYLGVFALQAVRNKLNSESLLDVNIVRRSILKFKCLTVVDEFFYPSALAFRTCCLSVHGAVNANYVGSQRQLLNDMTRAGPNCLVTPNELYNDVLVNGLLNHMQDNLAIRHLSLPRQRQVLMTMALEHNMCYFLNTCVISWNTNRYAQVGLTVRFFLDWAWKRIAHIKLTSDKLCQPLFNCSGQGIDKNSLQHVLSYQSQLKRISCILFAFQKSPNPKTESVKQELALRISVVRTIDVYLHVITWLYYTHLLPEYAEGVLLRKQEVAFPFLHLKSTYSERRSELQKLHSSIGASDILLIDGLMDEMGPQVGKLFSSRTGSILYPPPSIYAVIGSYLLEGASFLQKHQLLFYVILDMVAFLSDRPENLSDKLMKFPQAFTMSLSVAKLTRAFWLLDHENFEDALSTLLDPLVCGGDIAPWCHTRILKSFLYQGHEEKALSYMNYKHPPRNNFEDIKLHLTVLLANRCIGQAFLFQRKYQSEEHFEDLLNHLFDSCQQMNALSTLLKLPLNTMEHAALVNYLNNSSDPKLKEMLVMYYLLHCCPLDAAEVNDRLATEIPEDDEKAQEHAKIRSALVNTYMKTLPVEQKVLAQEIKRMASCRGPPHKDVAQVKPEPFSVTIKAQSMTAQSYADTLRSVMENIGSISMGSSGATESQCTPKTPSKVVFATPIPKRQGSRASGVFDNATPPKRARFMESLACRSLDPERRKTLSSMKAEVLSLLQTPPIFRKPPQIHSPAPLEGLDGATPPSILKIAKSGNTSDLPMQAASVSSNDAEASVDECDDMICDTTIPEDDMMPSFDSEASINDSEDLMCDTTTTTEDNMLLPSIVDDMQSKHLRFRDSSPQQQTVLDSKVENTISPRSSQQSEHTFSTPPERSFKVSPRRPLRDSDISLSSDSSSSDVFLAAKRIFSSTASSLPTTQNDSSNDSKHIVLKKQLSDDMVPKPVSEQEVHPDVLTVEKDQQTVPSASSELLREKRKASFGRASSLPTTQNDSSNDSKHIVLEKQLLSDDMVPKPVNVQEVHPDVLTVENDQQTVPSATSELLREQRKTPFGTGEDRNTSYECNGFKEDNTYSGEIAVIPDFTSSYTAEEKCSGMQLTDTNQEPASGIQNSQSDISPVCSSRPFSTPNDRDPCLIQNVQEKPVQVQTEIHTEYMSGVELFANAVESCVENAVCLIQTAENSEESLLVKQAREYCVPCVNEPGGDSLQIEIDKPAKTYIEKESLQHNTTILEEISSEVMAGNKIDSDTYIVKNICEDSELPLVKENSNFSKHGSSELKGVYSLLTAVIKKVVQHERIAGAHDDTSHVSGSLSMLVPIMCDDRFEGPSGSGFEKKKEETKFRTVLKPAQLENEVLEPSDESGEKEINHNEDNFGMQDKTGGMNKRDTSPPENSKLQKAISSLIEPKCSTSQFTIDLDEERNTLDKSNPPSMSGPYHGTRYRYISSSGGFKDAVPLSMRKVLAPPQLSKSTLTSSIKLEKTNTSLELQKAISSLIEPKCSTSQFTIDLDEERNSLDINNPPSMSGPYRGTRSRSRSSSDSLKDVVPQSMCEVFSPPQLFESSFTSSKILEKKNISSGSGDTVVLDKVLSGGILPETRKSRRRLRKGSTFDEKGDEPEYSFSEPTISGDPKISEALASPPTTPMPAFVFSPPLTRARLQLRKLGEAVRNPYMSASSDSPSHRKGKQLPVDPLLLDSSTLIPIESVITATPEMPHHSIKKSVARKKKITVHSQLTSSQRKSCLVSPSESEISSDINSHLNIARHSMRLRKAKMKRKSVKLW